MEHIFRNAGTSNRARLTHSSNRAPQTPARNSLHTLHVLEAAERCHNSLPHFWHEKSILSLIFILQCASLSIGGLVGYFPVVCKQVFGSEYRKSRVIFRKGIFVSIVGIIRVL